MDALEIKDGKCPFCSQEIPKFKKELVTDMGDPHLGVVADSYKNINGRDAFLRGWYEAIKWCRGWHTDDR